MRVFRIAAALALAAGSAAAAPAADGDPPGISLLTFAPGQVYWERFGHNALLVRDARDASATVYNYGMFDFQEENFFLNFARGRMQYHLAAWSLDDTLWIYDREGRGVVEQELNLTRGQRAELADYLAWNAQSQNAAYRYDYFTANCSTRLRDAIDRVVGGAVRRQLQSVPTGATYRSEALRLISPDRGWLLAMDLGLGPSADRPIDAWQQSFVPGALMAGLRTVRVAGADGRDAPLVAGERRLLPNHAPDAPRAPPDLLPAFLALGVGLAAVLLALARARARRGARIMFSALSCTLALLLGVGGLALAGIWGLTEHWAGARNPHLLQFDPLCLLMLPAWIKARRADWRPSAMQARLAVLIAGAGAAGLLLSLFGPGAATRHWIALVLPVLVALALACRRAATA